MEWLQKNSGSGRHLDGPEGAMADIVIFNKNFMQDVSIEDAENNLKVIIKDGKVYKNTL